MSGKDGGGYIREVMRKEGSRGRGLWIEGMGGIVKEPVKGKGRKDCLELLNGCP